MTFRPEDIDLAQLAEDLERTFGNHPPTGYLPGRTAFRDALVAKLGCSQLEAELLVETMISGGFLRYMGTPTEKIDELEPWEIAPLPQSSA